MCSCNNHLVLISRHYKKIVIMLRSSATRAEIIFTRQHFRRVISGSVSPTVNSMSVTPKLIEIITPSIPERWHFLRRAMSCGSISTPIPNGTVWKWQSTVLPICRFSIEWCRITIRARSHLGIPVCDCLTGTIRNFDKPTSKSLVLRIWQTNLSKVRWG